jgi:hypothetical protein
VSAALLPCQFGKQYFRPRSRRAAPLEQQAWVTSPCLISCADVNPCCLLADDGEHSSAVVAIDKQNRSGLTAWRTWPCRLWCTYMVSPGVFRLETSDILNTIGIKYIVSLILLWVYKQLQYFPLGREGGNNTYWPSRRQDTQPTNDSF